MRRRRRFATNSNVAARAALAAQPGASFGGKRDLYEAAGYDKSIDYSQYLTRFLRQGLAKRIVNMFPDETWRKSPIVLDGVEQQANDTEFVKAWGDIAYGGQIIDGETRKGLLHYLHRLDCLAGIGSYGIILFGLKDGKQLSDPVEAGSIQGTDGLLYVDVFEQGHAVIAQIETNRESSRFGKPTMYRLTFDSALGAHQVSDVHWSRIIHIVDGASTSDTIGTPRLEDVWNYLIDLDKIGAASGEAGWNLLNPGHIISTRDGYHLPVIEDDMSDDEIAATTQQIANEKEAIDLFVHGLRRWLEFDGRDITTLSGQLQDPTATFEMNITSICASRGIPKRIYLGNEAGDLASSEDEKTWAKAVATRQQNYAGPMILAPVLNRLIWYGVLPPPTHGQFYIKWHSLLEMDRSEQATIADTNADALAKAGIDADPVAFVTAYMPDLPIDKIAKKATVAPVLPQGGNLSANTADPFRWLNYP